MATIKYTESDIYRLLEETQSAASDHGAGEKQGNFTSDTDLAPLVGRKKDILGITPGFKLKNRATGLAYTVKEVSVDGNDVVMTIESGNGKSLTIRSKDFKHYERQ